MKVCLKVLMILLKGISECLTNREAVGPAGRYVVDALAKKTLMQVKLTDLVL